jgi:hypothetical protein
MSADPEPFQSAREFYCGDDADGLDRDADLPLAKVIIWYDQRTPLFVCAGCESEVRTLRHAGDAEAEDYDLRRASAYERLMNDAPACDACTGYLTEKIDR